MVAGANPLIFGELGRLHPTLVVLRCEISLPYPSANLMHSDGVSAERGRWGDESGAYAKGNSVAATRSGGEDRRVPGAACRRGAPRVRARGATGARALRSGGAAGDGRGARDRA